MEFTKTMGMRSATPLHFLAGSDSPYAYMMAQALLQKGADPNHRLQEGTNAGITPVLIAAAWGRLEMLKLLLMNGGDVGVTDGLGRTPREVARTDGKTEVVKFIDWWVKGLNPVAQESPEDAAEMLPTVFPSPVQTRNPAGSFAETRGSTKNITPSSNSTGDSPIHYVPRLFKSPMTPSASGDDENPHKRHAVHKCGLGSPNLKGSGRKTPTGTIGDPTGRPLTASPCKYTYGFNSGPGKVGETICHESRSSPRAMKCQSEMARRPERNMPNSQEGQPQSSGPVRRLHYYKSSPSIASGLHGGRQHEMSNKTTRDDPDVEIVAKRIGGLTLPNRRQSNGKVVGIESKPAQSPPCQADYLSSVHPRKPLRELDGNRNPGPEQPNPQFCQGGREVFSDSGMHDLLNETLTLLDSTVDKHELKEEFERLVEDSVCEDIDNAEWNRVLSLADQELRTKLLNYGQRVGPITPTTRDAYVKLLYSLNTKQQLSNVESARSGSGRGVTLSEKLFSKELTLACGNNFDTQLKDAVRDEKSLSAQFAANPPSNARVIPGSSSNVRVGPQWRGGTAKMSFCYLLLDPDVLFARSGADTIQAFTKLPETKQLEPFCHAVFYVGKGTKGRLYDHLKAALKYLDNNTSLDDIPNDKSRNIVEIWTRGSGIISLHVFHNIIPVEALTREAAMIEALRLCNLTNLRKGDLYGLAKTWTCSRTRTFGVHLLRRSLLIMLSDTVSPLRPDDVRK